MSEDQAIEKRRPRLRFTHNERLLKPGEFKRVFSRPLVSADRFFKVLARSGEQGGPRLGMAVSRQVDRRAVVRNRLKRLIRESFRLNFAEGGPAADFVVLPRRESATICNRQLRTALDKHWASLRARLEHRQEQH